jgi:hypothetical protein
MAPFLVSTTAAPTPVELTSLVAQQTYTVSHDLSEFDSSTWSLGSWYTISNVLSGSELNDSPIIGQGSESGDFYVYNNNNSANNAVMTGTVASLTFFLSKKQAKGIDYAGSPMSGVYSPLETTYITLFGIQTGTYTITQLAQIQITVTIPPTLTPLYIGKAVTDNMGNINFNDAVLSTVLSSGFANNQLIPKSYVDSTLASALSGLDAGLSPSDVTSLNNLIEFINQFLLGGWNSRMSVIEGQMERVYQALWDISRNAEEITTANGTYEVVPTSLSGFPGSIPSMSGLAVFTEGVGYNGVDSVKAMNPGVFNA